VYFIKAYLFFIPLARDICKDVCAETGMQNKELKRGVVFKTAPLFSYVIKIVEVAFSLF